MRTYNIEQLRSLCKASMLLLLMGSMGLSHAQSNNEISFFATGGFSKLDYEVLQNRNDLEHGWNFGVEYAHYLNENWSIASGLGYQTFQGTAEIASLKDAYSTVDLEGEAFEFRSTATNYVEEQSASYLNIPLKVQYETSGSVRFFVAAGAKVGFNLKSEYEAEASSLVTSGYYEQYDVELHAPEFAGYGDFGTYKVGESSLGLKTSYLAMLESGVKFQLESDESIYVGLFLDYGLNDIRDNADQKNAIEYNSENPSSFSGSSLLSSANKSTATAYTGKLKPLAFGVKFRYALGL